MKLCLWVTLTRSHQLVAALCLIFATETMFGAGRPLPSPSAKEIFERRIVPIFNSPNPSSCTQCHLAGVDLKNYILPSSEKTFLSLRDQGLINLRKPENSKILELINMGDNPGAQLIQQKVRQQEYEAFSEWIKASCKEPKLRAAPKLAAVDLARPKRPVEVIRHARVDRVLESFIVNVWSQRQRCLYCHSAAGGGNAKLVAEHEDVTWMKTSPEETMRYLLSSSLINSNEPAKSLLLLKPINQVKHAGGQKMLVGDMAYKSFRTWLEDYAQTVNDQYAQPTDLPRENSSTLAFGTRVRLKIANTPASWADQMLQVEVHAWDSQKGVWEPNPIATSDRGVWGKGKLWAHELWLLAPRGSERARLWQAGRPMLPQGRYLVRSFIDFQGKLQRDWTARLGKADFIGETEITTNWPEERETVIEADQLKR